jgi:hypothetical protein
MSMKLTLSVFAVATLALANGVGPARSATDPVCGTDSGSGVALATYQVQAGAPTTIDLGRGDDGTLVIPVTISGCHPPADSLPQGFTERFVSGSREFPQDQIKVVRDLAARHRLVISVTAKRGDVHPGTYTGNLDLDNAEVYGNALTIPVTITAEERPWWKVLIPTLALALVGGFFLLWLQSGGTGNAPIPFFGWLWRLRTWVAVGFGVAGAVGVWWKRYLDVSTWTFAEFTALVTVMVVAFTGAAAIAAGAASVGTAARRSDKLRKREEEDSLSNEPPKEAGQGVTPEPPEEPGPPKEPGEELSGGQREPS